MHPLDGVWAKLSRANGHRHAIEDLVERWTENKPYEFIHDEESKPGWTILSVRIRQPLPIELGAIIGDYIHSTRSALDQLVWQLVIVNGGTPGKHTQFPIAIEPDYFIEKAITGKKAMLAGIPEHAVTYIRSQQPYERGNDAPNHPLAILQDLWNTDKHKTIAQAVTLFEPVSTPDKHLGRGGIEPPTSRAIEDGMELGRWRRLPPNPPNPDGSVTGRVHSVGNTEVGVLFGESRITLKTLVSLRKEAKRIVDHCAVFFR